MTTQQIQIILEIYRTGSISKAAKNLFLAQPNISNSLRLLEEELGFPIFVRSNKGVQPTVKGMMALEQAGLMWESYQKMQETASRTETTRVHIGGSSYTPICEAYVKLCTEYQHNRTLNLSFSWSGSVQEACDQLYLSKLDLATLAIPPGSPESQRTLEQETENKGLAFTEIAQVPLCLRIGSQHPLYREPDPSLSDFQDYPYVDYPSKPFLALKSPLPYIPDRVMLTDDKQSKLELVSRTCAYSIGCQVPASLTQRLGLRNIPMGDLKFHIVALTRKDQKPSEYILRYLELLQEEITAL